MTAICPFTGSGTAPLLELLRAHPMHRMSPLDPVIPTFEGTRRLMDLTARTPEGVLIEAETAWYERGKHDYPTSFRKVVDHLELGARAARALNGVTR